MENNSRSNNITQAAVNPPPPVRPNPSINSQPQTAIPEVKPTRFNYISFIFFALLLLGLFLPTSIPLLALPILIFGALAAANLFKDSAKTNKSANVAVKAFKILAIIGLTIVVLIVAGIGLLILAFSAGGGIG